MRAALRAALRAAVLALLVPAGPAAAAILSGVVRDAATGTPLPGAFVAAGDTLGAVCDTAGRFRLRVPAGTVELEVTMVGYERLAQRLRVPERGFEGLFLDLTVKVLPMPETLVQAPGRLPRFTDVGVAAGLDFRHDFGGQRIENILQATGAGACFFDADGDGDHDLYLVNGSYLQPRTGPAPTNALFANDGDGSFTDATGATGTGDGGYGMGCTAADYDADGDRDLYVTNYGANVLYRNEGAAFTEVAATAGVADPRWSVGATWIDYDNDGALDLFVGNYLDFDPDAPPVRSLGSLHEGYRTYPGPRDFDGQPDALYANRGDGTFADVSAAVGLNPQVAKAMGCAVADYDGDGDMDLFVANDRTPNQLYRNDGGRFVEIGLEAGVAFDEAGHESGAMGVYSGDTDGDGRLDLLVTNFSFEYNSLYRNRGDGSFADATTAAGLATPSYRYVGWGSVLFDYDSDGFLDLFVANGDVHEDLDMFSRGVSFAQPDQLFRNLGDGTFADASRHAGGYFLHRAVGRGAAAADYDDDGDLDLVVVHLGDRPSLLRNDGGNRRHWLSLRLRGVRCHPDAVGARVDVRAGALRMVRYVHTAASYLSQGDDRLYFGLAGHVHADTVTVHWPDGESETLLGLPADRHLTLTQGLGVTGRQVADGAPPQARGHAP